MPERKLRILQVMRAPVGGLFRHVADLTRALTARGHEVGLVVDSLANDGQTESKLTDLAQHASLGVHRFAMPRLLGAGDLSVPLALRGLGRKLDIDIYHGHGAKGGFYARLARLGGGKAIALYTPHGGVLHFSTRSRAGRVFHGLERRLMALTAAIIFESQFARRTYSSLIVEPTCPSPVIHNGLVPAEFEPVTPDPDAADFVFVGELRLLKGIHVLVEAMAGLTAPDGRPATLVMAGDGGDRQGLLDRIAHLGLADQVTLVGVQPARAMFARGHCAVVPSLAESLPYVVLEAAAARLPVIATRVGGIPEIFGPTASSLVPADDAEALRRAMAKVLQDPYGAEAEMAMRFEHIAAEFSLERMASSIEALYVSLLAKA
jgi:glycosyltransferase involved in cell wall biosynthesis